jgi:hypothetical protein
MGLRVLFTLISLAPFAGMPVCLRHRVHTETSSDDLPWGSCRSKDVLAHRQLSAAISHTPLHGSLHSKSYVEKTLNVVNRRHRLAQMAGRASVEFYVGLALKARGQRDGNPIDVIENAFVIRVFRNGLAVFVSSYVQAFSSIFFYPFSPCSAALGACP